MYKTSEDLRRLFRSLKRADDGSDIALPDTVLQTIQPTFELCDWSSYRDTQFNAASQVNVATVNGPVVPENTMRLVLHASVGDVLLVGNDRLLWISRIRTATGFGVSAALFVPTAILISRTGFNKPLIMLPGDNLAARSEPGAGVGDTLQLRQAFIDFPIDEATPIPPT